MPILKAAEYEYCLSFQNMLEISCVKPAEIAKKSNKQFKLIFLYIPVLNKFQYNVCVSWNACDVMPNFRPDLQNLDVRSRNLKSS